MYSLQAAEELHGGFLNYTVEMLVVADHSIYQRFARASMAVPENHVASLALGTNNKRGSSQLGSCSVECGERRLVAFCTRNEFGFVNVHCFTFVQLVRRQRRKQQGREEKERHQTHSVLLLSRCARGE